MSPRTPRCSPPPPPRVAERWRGAGFREGVECVLVTTPEDDDEEKAPAVLLLLLKDRDDACCCCLRCGPGEDDDADVRKSADEDEGGGWKVSAPRLGRVRDFVAEADQVVLPPPPVAVAFIGGAALRVL